MSDGTIDVNADTILSADSGDAAPPQDNGQGDTPPADNQDGGQDGQAAGEPTGDEPNPVEYTDFTVPEGSIALDEAKVGEFKELAKANNLSQEQAQNLINFYAQIEADRIDGAWKTVKEDWLNKAREDQEFGGTNFDANIKIAQRALNTFATPELKHLFNEYGIGNNPEMIRLMYRIGKAIGEDNTLVTGQQSGELSPEERMKKMYPNTYK